MSNTLIASQVAEPYAQALMSVAQAQGLVDEFGNNFREIEALLTESADLREFIANPVIKPEDKKNVIKRVMGDTNPYLLNFLLLLVDKRRIAFLAEVAAQYLNLLRKLKQTVLAEVISAKELSDEQKQSVIEKVKGMTNASDLELKTTIDPSLLGGLIIKVGSQVLDASVRGQLRRIGMSLG
jgi:F-type H+-transporting ATPase subunit delta